MKAVQSILFLLITIFSVNANAQWALLNSGTSNSLNRVDFSSKNVGYVLPYSGHMLRTLDGGVSWDSLTSLILSASLLFDNNISFVNDSVGFITTHKNGELKLYKTANMGNSWTDISPDTNLWGILKVQFLNEQKGYLYLSDASYRFWTTNNGGATWIEYPLTFGLGSGTSSMPSMFFVNDSTGYLVGGDGSFFYKGIIARTDDEGQNWFITTLPNEYSLVNSIHFPNKDTGYTVSRNGNIFRTLDEGDTWDSVTTLNNSTAHSEVFFPNGKTGYVISGSNIYKTTDGGISWSIDFTATGIDLHSMDFPKDTTGYIVGSKGSILKNSISSGIAGPHLGKKMIRIYPNPTSSKLNIQKNSDQAIQFTIYTILGEKIKDELLTNKISLIDLTNYPNGIYLYKSIDVSNRITTGKIIKRQ